jgi:hypothetical protein
VQPVDEAEALRIEARLAAIVQIRRIENARHEHLAAIRREARRRQIKGRVGTAIGLVSATAVTAHAASASYFKGTAAVTQTTSAAGDAKISGTNPVSQHFDLNATDFYPGQTRARAITLTISGNLDLKSASLEFTSGANCTGCQTGLLDNDATNGLQVKVEVCPTGNAFVQSGSSPDASATCGGSSPGTLPWSTVVASTPLATIMRNGTHDGSVDISTGLTLTAGATNNLIVEYTLPTGTSNATQGLTGATSSIIDIKFLGVSRDGTTK